MKALTRGNERNFKFLILRSFKFSITYQLPSKRKTKKMRQCGTQKLNYQEATIWLSASHFTKDMLETFRDLISSNVGVYEY